MLKMIRNIIDRYEIEKERRNPPERVVTPSRVEHLNRFYYENGFYLYTLTGETNIPKDEWRYYFIHHPQKRDEGIMSVKEFMFWKSQPLPNRLISGL